jgi:hypothetical protein
MNLAYSSIQLFCAPLGVREMVCGDPPEMPASRVSAAVGDRAHVLLARRRGEGVAGQWRGQRVVGGVAGIVALDFAEP